MMVRKTLQWIATILALGSTTGAADTRIGCTRKRMNGCAPTPNKRLLKRIPNAVISIGRARFDWSRKIHLYDVRLSAKGLDEPVRTASKSSLRSTARSFRRTKRLTCVRSAF